MTTLAALRRELSAARTELRREIEQARGEIAGLRAQAAPGAVPWLDITLAPPSAWAAMPAALTGYLGSMGYARRIDLSGYTQVRLRAIKLGTAGHTGAKLYLRFRDGFSVTAGDYDRIGAHGECEVAIDTTNALLDSGWIMLAQAARDDVFVALLGEGGNGAASPAFGLVRLEAKGGVVEDEAIPGGGSGGDNVQALSANVSDVAGFGGTAAASYALESGGDTVIVPGSVLGAWIANPANAANYEARATHSGDALDGTSSATGSWLGLGGGAFWLLAQSGAGEKYAEIIVEIRPAGGEAIASALVTLEAAVYPGDIP